MSGCTVLWPLIFSWFRILYVAFCFSHGTPNCFGTLIIQLRWVTSIKGNFMDRYHRECWREIEEAECKRDDEDHYRQQVSQNHVQYCRRNLFQSRKKLPVEIPPTVSCLNVLCSIHPAGSASHPQYNCRVLI